MATVNHSSLQAWLNFDAVNLPPIPSCQYANFTSPNPDETGLLGTPILTNASCAQVCNDTASLFALQSDNLVTCGLFTSIVSAFTYLEPNNTLVPNKNSNLDNLTSPIQWQGLIPNEAQYAPLYADVIGDCFEVIYLNIKEYSFSDDGQVAAACTRDQLFPFGSNSNDTHNTTSALGDCLNAICSPLTLNPDLAGVGVFSSFIIQSSIAILALVALLGLELASKLLQTASAKMHSENLVAALVDFHKAQCYFSSVIQITALALFRDSRSGSLAVLNSGDPKAFKDLFDTFVLVVLATGGFIPINLTLACITRYGRQSWYLLFLSLITTILASATLIASYNYSEKYGKDLFYSNNVNNTWNDANSYGASSHATCNIQGPVNNTVIPLCGNSDLVNNALPSGTIANWWTWIVWANCIIWLFYCLGRKCYDSDRFGSYRERWRAFWGKRTWVQVVAMERNAHKTWILTSVISWSLCFASQFYLFSAYFKHAVISGTWSFGQIIAVTIWVPCIVEYIYIEINGIEAASKYRYPSPLMVMRETIGSSISLSNLGSPQPRKDEESMFGSQVNTALLSESN